MKFLKLIFINLLDTGITAQSQAGIKNPKNTPIIEPKTAFLGIKLASFSSDIKISIQYVDSWGHLWKGKVAWPKEELFIEYLNKRLNE